MEGSIRLMAYGLGDLNAWAIDGSSSSHSPEERRMIGG